MPYFLAQLSIISSMMFYRLLSALSSATHVTEFPLDLPPEPEAEPETEEATPATDKGSSTTEISGDCDQQKQKRTAATTENRGDQASAA